MDVLRALSLLLGLGLTMLSGCTALLSADDLRQDEDGAQTETDVGVTDASPGDDGAAAAPPDVAADADTTTGPAVDASVPDSAGADAASDSGPADTGGPADVVPPSDGGNPPDTALPKPTLQVEWSGATKCEVDIVRKEGVVGITPDTCSPCGEGPTLLFKGSTDAVTTTDWSWDFDKLPAGWAFNLQVTDEDTATASVVLLPPSGDDCDSFTGGTITFSVSVSADGYELEESDAVAIVLEESGACPGSPHDCAAP